MKKAFKLLSVILSFAMLFALCACSPSTKQPDDQNSDQPDLPNNEKNPNNPGGQESPNTPDNITDSDDSDNIEQTEEEWRKEILSAELTEIDKNFLNDKSNYKDESLFERVQKDIVVKIYRGYFIYVTAEDTVEDVRKSAEDGYDKGFYYLILSEDPIRIGDFSSDVDDLLDKMFEQYSNLDKACHIHDLLSLKKSETFLGQECQIQKVIYFENGIGTFYYHDVIVAFVTDKGNYVRYYNDYPWQTEAVVFSEAEFNAYAEAYRNYIIDHAYDENGNPTIGLPGSFLDFVELMKSK